MRQNVGVVTGRTGACHDRADRDRFDPIESPTACNDERSVSRLLLLLVLLLPTAAFADGPNVEVGDGWVRGSIEIDAPKDKLLEFLRDPHNIARVEGRGSEIEVRPEAGCDQVHASIPTVIGTLRYIARRCPEDGGFHSWLVSSDDFERYEAIWRVEETEDGGSLLRYKVASKTNLPVPEALHRRQTKRAVKSLLRAVRDQFED